MIFKKIINLGIYYTPQHIVDKAYTLLINNNINISDYTILDTSCGCFSFKPDIGADIDSYAVDRVRREYPNCHILNHNSLLKISRKDYSLSDTEKVIIVGNPPYNDLTSLNKKKIKNSNYYVSNKILKRDLGMSFLMSYNELKVDYICILHPLSYIIKKSNFSQLINFFNNYKLIDNLIINSQIFPNTSKSTGFPIIIALYKRSIPGMSYQDVCNIKFKTYENTCFSISHFDYIGKYIDKYPNHKKVSLKDTVAYFWTLRDINALRRNKTFLQKETTNSIRVTKENLYLYKYVDTVKNNIQHFPYYLGNLDIPINFTILGSKNYFKNLLGEHYVD